MELPSSSPIISDCEDGDIYNQQDFPVKQVQSQVQNDQFAENMDQELDQIWKNIEQMNNKTQSNVNSAEPKEHGSNFIQDILSNKKSLSNDIVLNEQDFRDSDYNLSTQRQLNTQQLTQQNDFSNPLELSPDPIFVNNNGLQQIEEEEESMAKKESCCYSQFVSITSPSKMSDSINKYNQDFSQQSVRNPETEKLFLINKNLKKQLEHTQNQYQILQSNYTNIEKSHIKISKEYSRLQKENDMLSEKCDILENENKEQLNNMLQKLEEECNNIKQESNQLQQDYINQIQQKDNLLQQKDLYIEKEIQKNNASSSRFHIKDGNIQAQLKNADLEIQELYNSVQEQKKQVINKDKEIQELKERVITLKNEKKQLTEQIDSIQDTIEKPQPIYQEDQNLQQHYSQLRVQYQELQQEMQYVKNSDISKFSTVNQKIEDLLEEQKLQNFQLDDENKYLKQRIINLEQEVGQSFQKSEIQEEPIEFSGFKMILSDISNFLEDFQRSSKFNIFYQQSTQNFKDLFNFIKFQSSHIDYSTIQQIIGYFLKEIECYFKINHKNNQEILENRIQNQENKIKINKFQEEIQNYQISDSNLKSEFEVNIQSFENQISQLEQQNKQLAMSLQEQDNLLQQYQTNQHKQNTNRKNTNQFLEEKLLKTENVYNQLLNMLLELIQNKELIQNVNKITNNLQIINQYENQKVNVQSSISSLEEGSSKLSNNINFAQQISLKKDQLNSLNLKIVELNNQFKIIMENLENLKIKEKSKVKNQSRLMQEYQALKKSYINLKNQYEKENQQQVINQFKQLVIIYIQNQGNVDEDELETYNLPLKQSVSHKNLDRNYEDYEDILNLKMKQSKLIEINNEKSLKLQEKLEKKRIKQINSPQNMLLQEFLKTQL